MCPLCSQPVYLPVFPVREDTTSMGFLLPSVHSRHRGCHLLSLSLQIFAWYLPLCHFISPGRLSYQPEFISRSPLSHFLPSFCLSVLSVALIVFYLELFA